MSRKILPTYELRIRLLSQKSQSLSQSLILFCSALPPYIMIFEIAFFFPFISILYLQLIMTFFFWNALQLLHYEINFLKLSSLDYLEKLWVHPLKFELLPRRKTHILLTYQSSSLHKYIYPSSLLSKKIIV
jgi:hypothetical protein